MPYTPYRRYLSDRAAVRDTLAYAEVQEARRKRVAEACRRVQHADADAAQPVGDSAVVPVEPELEQP